MREYREDGTLAKVVCNQCKKVLENKKTILEADWLSVDKEWGYFSGKDGEIHSFDLCETCYDRLVRGFLIPPASQEQTELI